MKWYAWAIVALVGGIAFLAGRSLSDRPVVVPSPDISPYAEIIREASRAGNVKSITIEDQALGAERELRQSGRAVGSSLKTSSGDALVNWVHEPVTIGTGTDGSITLGGGGVCVTGDKLLHDYAVQLRNGSTKLAVLGLTAKLGPVIVLGKGAQLDSVAYGPPNRRQHFDLGERKPRYAHCLDVAGKWANVCIPLPILLRERARA